MAPNRTRGLALLTVILAFVGVARATDPAPKQDDPFHRALAQASASPATPPTQAAQPSTPAPRQLRQPLGVGMIPATSSDVVRARNGARVAHDNSYAVWSTGQSARSAADEITVDANIRANTTEARAREAHTVLAVEQHQVAVDGQRYGLVTQAANTFGGLAREASQEQHATLRDLDEYDRRTFDMAVDGAYTNRRLDSMALDNASRPLGDFFGGVWVVVTGTNRDEKARIGQVVDSRIARNEVIQNQGLQTLSEWDRRRNEALAQQAAILGSATPIATSQGPRSQDSSSATTVRPDKE